MRECLGRVSELVFVDDVVFLGEKLDVVSERAETSEQS
jgi:hypothetical protein